MTAFTEASFSGQNFTAIPKRLAYINIRREERIAIRFLKRRENDFHALYVNASAPVGY